MAVMASKNIGLALRTMRGRRGRSGLTMLGIVIAVASVTLVVSIGHGIQASVAHQANQYNKNVITVEPAEIGGSSSLASLSGTGIRASITARDAASVAKQKHVAAAVALSVVGSSTRGDNQFDGPVFGASTDLSAVINQQLAYGGFFTATEATNNVAVLGATAADKLFDQKVPLGRGITINGQQFIVGGVLDKFADSPFSGNANFNDAIFVPSAAGRSLVPSGAPIYKLLVKVDDARYVAAADKSITAALARNHGTSRDLQVLSPTELATDTTATFNLLTNFILAAALITLLVSGIGIMNVMLVSVTERLHEIGIRKAVGATNRQILGQFLTEAATLSLVGSFIGAVLALAAVWLLRAFTNLEPTYDWRVAGLACAAAIIFGVLFGTLPAIKAARKDPISALRSI